jgi:hypothetical protein
MSTSNTRLAIIPIGLAALALAACGGTPAESPFAPAGAGDDAALFSTLGNGPGNGGTETPAGDGVCDGTGDGTCDGTGQGPGNGQGNGYGNGNGQGPGNGQGNGACDGAGSGYGNDPGDADCDGTVVGTDPDDLQGVLVEALQEEYLAEMTYRRVLADFGEVAPFSFIAESEAQHVTALLGLFARRQWTGPEAFWTLGNVSTFDTVTLACAGGVAVEIEDGALYERYLSREDLPSDVVNVFTRLQAASLENHLPAFERCR